MTSPHEHDQTDRIIDPDDGSPTCCTSLDTSTALSRRIDEVVGFDGLSVNQYTTLSVLRAGAGCPTPNSPRRALVSPQSMNEVLLTLERRGLVGGVPTPNMAGSSKHGSPPRDVDYSRVRRRSA